MAAKFARLGAKKIVLLDMNGEALESAKTDVEAELVDASRQSVHSCVANLATQTQACQAMKGR